MGVVPEIKSLHHNLSVAGAVILYNPSFAVVENIESYLDSVHHLYVIDNSEQKSCLIDQLLDKSYSFKLSYIANKVNKGVGEALNQASQHAIADGFKWLLTMDQDSRFTVGAMPYLMSELDNTIRTTSVGIFSANLVIANAKDILADEGIQPVQTALTSGSLLNLDAYSVCGPFMSKFFIDQIDHEYSLRVRKNHFAVLKCNGAHLLHQLGENNTHKLLGRLINVTHHNYVRRYYMTRNRLKVCLLYFRTFPKYSFSLLWFSLTDILLVLIFEKDKLRKLRSIFLGIRDFVAGRYGAYCYK